MNTVIPYNVRMLNDKSLRAKQLDDVTQYIVDEVTGYCGYVFIDVDVVISPPREKNLDVREIALTKEEAVSIGKRFIEHGYGACLGYIEHTRDDSPGPKSWKLYVTNEPDFNPDKWDNPNCHKVEKIVL